MDLNELCSILKDNKLKITEQRKAILITLYENKNVLMNVDEILSIAKTKCSKINASTVYRNIDALIKLNLLYKHATDSSILYKLDLGSNSNHQMICTECGKIENIDFCPLSAFKGLIDEKNFSLKSHKLELFGECDDCSNKHK